jgi:hypothetical protein
VYSDNAYARILNKRRYAVKRYFFSSKKFRQAAGTRGRIGSLSVVAMYHTPDCTPGDRIQHQLLTAKSATYRDQPYSSASIVPSEDYPLSFILFPSTQCSQISLDKIGLIVRRPRAKTTCSGNAPSWKSNHLNWSLLALYCKAQLRAAHYALPASILYLIAPLGIDSPVNYGS